MNPPQKIAVVRGRVNARRMRTKTEVPLRDSVSGKQLGCRFGFDQLAGLVEVVIDDRRRVDAEAVVDRGQQLAGMDRVV